MVRRRASCGWFPGGGDDAESNLPDDLKSETGQLTTDQLIGLRFASDAELAGLVRRVLAGELTDREFIKQAIEDWRADHQRI